MKGFFKRLIISPLLLCMQLIGLLVYVLIDDTIEWERIPILVRLTNWVNK